MNNTQPVILYFILGPVPTNKQINEASDLAADVRYRNAHHVDTRTGLENCDGVAGEVPEAYQKHPNAKEAIANHTKARKARQKATQDAKAPKVKHSIKTPDAKAPEWGAGEKPKADKEEKAK